MKIIEPEFFKRLQKTRDRLYTGSGISTTKPRFTVEPLARFSAKSIPPTQRRNIEENLVDLEQKSTFQFEQDIYDWGEILVWRLRVFFVEGENTQQKDFYLVGDFDKFPLQEIHIRKSLGNILHVTCKLEGLRYEYDFSSEIDNLIVPSIKKDAGHLAAGHRNVKVKNLKDETFIGLAQTSDSWLQVVPEVKIEPQDSANMILRIRWDKIELGRNVATVELKKRDTGELQRLEVCAWVNVLGTIGEEEEFVFDVNEKEQEFHFSATKSLKYQWLTLDENPWSSFPLFRDTQFALPGEGAQRAFLTGDFNEWKSPAYRMERKGETFEILLALEDGEYYYRFWVDGETRFDSLQPSTVYITEHGVASVKKIQRCTRRVVLHNRDASTLSGSFEPQADWLKVSQSEITLDAGRKGEITLNLVPSHLSPGPNYSSLDIISKDNPYCRWRIPIFVNAIVHGAVIEPHQTKSSLPSFRKGQSVDATLEFDIIGKGNLSAQIFPSHFVEEKQGRFSLTNSEQLKSQKHSLTVPLKTHSLQTRNYSFRGMFINDCYLANRRVIPIDWQYSNVKQLKFYPSVLHFPTVFYQDAQHLLLWRIQWNNGEPAEGLVFNIPETMSDFLHVESSNSPGKYEVYLDSKQITKTGIISEKISIFEPNTRLTDSVLVIAQIVASTCKAIISQPTNETSDGKLSLVIKNTGNEPLKIFDIQTENGRFRCEPKLVEEPVIAPGESLDFFLVSSVKASSFTERIVKDGIIIKTNDFENPNFRIDASIVISPRIKLFAKRRGK